MKKYRLKKDLPTVRAGEVFMRKTNETMQTDMIYHVDSEDVFLPPSIEVDDIHNFDEWFEEVKEFKEWSPKEGERYKCMDANGELFEATFLKDEIDEYRELFSNLYPLDTPDEAIIKEQKLIPQAMHRLKMAAKKAWFEFNGSEGPDWSNPVQEKWAIRWCQSTMTVKPSAEAIYQTQGVVHFPTEDSCRDYADNNPEDMKLLFGVE